MIPSIYESYFQILEEYYGRYFKESNPRKSVNRLLKQPMTSRILYETSDTVIQEISNLLLKNAKRIINDLTSLQGIKTFYTGSIGPLNAKQFLCRTGLYVDTTVISDPLTFINASEIKKSNKGHFIRLLFKYAFHMLELKGTMINDLEIPILRIVPRPVFIEAMPEDLDDIEEQTIDYFNDLMNMKITSITELESLLDELRSKEDLLSKITDQQILIPEITRSKDLSTGLDNLHEVSQKYGYFENSVAHSLYYNALGSIRGNLSHLNFARSINSTNSFDSPNSWHYFKWMINNQSRSVNERTLVINSITLDHIKWFRGLKLDDVIKARELSQLQEFREILHKELHHTNEDRNIGDIAKQVEYNLKVAFSNHERDFKNIRNDFALAYSSSSLGLVGGTIAVLHGLITQDSVTLFSGGLALGGTLFNWIKSMTDCNRDLNIINSPIGLLFDARSDHDDK